ncbi:hypothetical protein AAMO2058_001525700, partial [Amorphochlora amoebiformis]
MRDESGWTGLHHACNEQNEDALETLLYASADTNVPEPANGATPMHFCAQLGWLRGVQLLVRHGAEIDVTLKDGASPVLVACQEGHADIIRYLCDQGGDIDRPNSQGHNPLLSAVAANRPQSVEALIYGKVSVNKKESSEGVFPLYLAAQDGYVDIARMLIEAGAKLNQVSDHGASPLFIACQLGQVEIAKLLLDNGADVDQPDHFGTSPLAIALSKNHMEVVQMLLRAGANVDRSVNADGLTPLFVAASKGQRDMFSKLLNLGANLTYRTKRGETFLHAIASKNHVIMLPTLQQLSKKG